MFGKDQGIIYISQTCPLKVIGAINEKTTGLGAVNRLDYRPTSIW